MGLDYGERRIGVAISDPSGMIAQPLATLERARRGAPEPLERIAELVDEYEVEHIVVGLPLHMDGTSGEQAAKARAFAGRVAARTGLPVDLVDERWTSVEARRTLREAGLSARKQKGKVDPVAAALLLRTWLEQQA